MSYPLDVHFGFSLDVRAEGIVRWIETASEWELYVNIIAAQDNCRARTHVLPNEQSELVASIVESVGLVDTAALYNTPSNTRPNQFSEER